jgi:hypothetical protein
VFGTHSLIPSASGFCSAIMPNLLWEAYADVHHDIDYPVTRPLANVLRAEHPRYVVIVGGS